MRDKFLVTPQICLAINDIDYVLQFIDPFVKGMYIKNKLFTGYKIFLSNKGNKFWF